MSEIKKGADVLIMRGRDRKKTGKVLRVFPDRQWVLVEGMNLRKRHMRPSMKHKQGGVVDKECPIHISNVRAAGERKKKS